MNTQYSSKTEREKTLNGKHFLLTNRIPEAISKHIKSNNRLEN